MKQFLFSFVLACTALHGNASTKEALPAYMGADRVMSEEVLIKASRTELNRIVFPQPFVNLMMQGSVPIKNEFMPVSKNRGILFELQKDAQDSFQVIAELQDGSVKNLRIVPDDRPGIIFRVAGAADRPKTETAETLTGHERAVEIMKDLLLQSQVDGFEPVRMPSPALYDRMIVDPIYAASDGYRRIFIYELIAKGDFATQVAPPQFYTEGVEYILIDGDVVTPSESLIMYVIMNESTFIGG